MNESSSPPPSGSDDPLLRKIALYAVPVIVVLVALFQRYMAEVHDMNPWKGGGYGMFADIHRGHYRVLVLETNDGAKRFAITVPPTFDRESLAVRTVPTESRLASFGQELLDQEWILVGQGDNAFPTLAVESFRYPNAPTVTLRGMKLRVLEPTFADAKVSYEVLRTATVGTGS